jgi:propionyl-CoA carboxylase alpha chain
VPEARRITKLLVANRGEIARRVFAACRRMGIATVAVHSDVDAGAPFVLEADEAVSLGGITAAESYLRADSIVEAARRTGADAVHPGYGFLAENAAFARSVADAGLVWVGPPPAAIEAMGSKVGARAMMEAAGVPVLPGAELPGDVDADELAKRAESIGFPLLVKASAGGGGKGMRSVAEPGELVAAVEGARREAESAFGDGTIFLERMLEQPRHVEIQVFADADGNTVSLGERECSIQRRHQKVVEEAPSPVVDAELRARMGEAAVSAAKAVDYEGAGTVEFLLAPDGEFFFLEMNTRLQVEHPVTEMVTGLDLVRLQLLVASGEPLPANAAPDAPRGHAIEVRLYAEDAAADFLPQTGTLACFAVTGETGEPAGTFTAPDGDTPERGLRLDSGFEAGDEVSPHYDPMLAKLIAWAPTRGEAAGLLAAALRRAHVDGLVTNRDFLVNVLGHEAFLAGETDTGFLGRHDGLAAPLVDDAGARLAAAAAALASKDVSGGGDPAGPPLAFAPRGWRNNPSSGTVRGYEGTGDVSYRLGRGGRDVDVEVGGEPLGPLAIDGEPALAGPDGDGSVTLVAAGVRRRFDIRRRNGIAYVTGPAGTVALPELPRYPADEEAEAEGALVAPMPGKVIRLAVSEGASVTRGDVVAVLEAMKMEHELTATAAGTVSELRVSEGDQVDSGAVIGVIESPEE